MWARRTGIFSHGRVVEPLVMIVALVAAALTPAAWGAEPTDDYDVLIRGGRIIDGTGRAARAGDVGIREGRIAAVGDLSGARARDVVDAADRIVCPGFVDLHTHVDRGILKFRDAENYIRQGVTTLVCGNCGSSPTDLAGFARALRDGGTGPNIVMLIGHGSVRGAVIGQEPVAPSAA